MKRNNRRNRTSNENSLYEKLEHRRCLAVVIGAANGNMWVEGNADGLVEIYASGDSTFTVKDNGAEIGTVENVSKNLRILLDQDGSAQNDQLSLNVLDEAFENVSINLGHGDNHVDVSGTLNRGWPEARYVQRLRIQGGEGNDSANVDLITTRSTIAQLGKGDDSVTLSASTGHAMFRGGFGNDHFEVTEEGSHESFGPKIGKIVGLMGPGDDTVNIDAEAYANVHVLAGRGSDSVEFGEDAVLVEAFVHLGDGNNDFQHHGWVASDFRLRAGSGNDNFTFAEGSMAARGIKNLLGEGTNTCHLAGAIRGDVYLRGESGNDDVSLGESTEILGEFIGVLGDGDNTLHNLATITGDFEGFSRNELDTFTNDGNVEGGVNLKPGGQTW